MATDAKTDLEIFLVAAPGTEAMLCSEAKAFGFTNAKQISGGVTVSGPLTEAWRANLLLRCCTRVLVRIGAFHAAHLAQLDKLARQFPWRQFLRSDVHVSVEATCRKSRIYHAGAAAQRIATAIREELGAEVNDNAEVSIKARFENNLCTLSIDTSGNSLHKRGHKTAIAKAPMRETLAAHFLRRCAFSGTEPIYDPMCGSGTFIIEAAEIAKGLAPGRARDFAFEQLQGFDANAWQAMRAAVPATTTLLRFSGSDRDAGAIRMAQANAARAGVMECTEFRTCAVSDAMPPDGPPGLVMVNPPYGTRIGDKKPLLALHAALGQTLMTRFKGWRVGLVTTEPTLAKATGLPFLPPDIPVNHGGLRVLLFRTKTLT